MQHVLMKLRCSLCVKAADCSCGLRGVFLAALSVVSVMFLMILTGAGLSCVLFQHPYPSEEQKKQLAQDTGLTILQVNNW